MTNQWLIADIVFHFQSVYLLRFLLSLASLYAIYSCCFIIPAFSLIIAHAKRAAPFTNVQINRKLFRTMRWYALKHWMCEKFQQPDTKKSHNSTLIPSEWLIFWTNSFKMNEFCTFMASLWNYGSMFGHCNPQWTNSLECVMSIIETDHEIQFESIN